MARHPPKTDVTFPGTEVSLPIESLSASIVTELAAGLSDAEGIRERYGISEAQWSILKRTPLFRTMLKEAIERLAGDMNAKHRITMKAEVALEDAIPILDEIAHDRDAQSSARIDAVKTMAQLSGRNAKDAPQGSTGGFSLNIIIKDSEKGVTIEGQPVQPLLTNDE